MTGLQISITLQWLFASLGLVIFYGLLKMGVAVSRMTADEDGNFEIVSRKVSPLLLADKNAKLGVKYESRKVSQKEYELLFNLLAAIVGTASLGCFAGFLVSLFTT
ncbi:hypothetical protein K3553_03645 [Leisingera aquaemixtae]|uniref:hypothetical protein n=1 Tax=Leisingera aquaemixtae TaxID=1396826 RepID=UPI0021A5B630|nr:hypothetical protein [Leisingera aquaemixtae]UWQ25573.1 hypothetical protein K3553_03645 [Leisingera aquaemixtae]UWQ38085.1 hypothetical protein K3552_03470 [Leisingera aquaemixtae]